MNECGPIYSESKLEKIVDHANQAALSSHLKGAMLHPFQVIITNPVPGTELLLIYFLWLYSFSNVTVVCQ